MRHPTRSNRPDDRRRGSVMLFSLVMATVFGFLLTFYLQQSTVRTKAARTRMESISALYTAFGELEKGRVAISTGGYTSGKNNAIQDAMKSPAGKIAETDVVVTPIGDANGPWYDMRVTVPYDVVYERVISQPVREINYFSSYNLFVANDKAGVSGSPVGNIHSNDKILFYFPGGEYRSPVTAVKGFEYVASSGATASNTQLLGSYNAAADRIDIDFEDDPRFSLGALKANVKPSSSFTDDLMLRFYRRGKDQWVRIQNWSKRFKEKTKRTVPVYKRVVDKSKGKVKKKRYKTIRQKVWVSSSSKGTTVAGSGTAKGYWTYKRKRVPYTYYAYPKKRIKVGTRKVTRTRTKYPTVYRKLPHEAVIYTTGNIRQIYGDVVGRVTVASEGNITIRHNLKYRDPKGHTAYLNGTAPRRPYKPNPKYTGDATLGLIAKKDVRYSRYTPASFEVNASMVAIEGRVGIEGLTFKRNGDVKRYNRRFKKTSIRRLGGITSSRRPIETFVKNGQVVSGFRSGESVFDTGVVGHPPPFFLSMPEPTFFATTIVK